MALYLHVVPNQAYIIAATSTAKGMEWACSWNAKQATRSLEQTITSVAAHSNHTATHWLRLAPEGLFTLLSMCL